jgi:MFS family permease
MRPLGAAILIGMGQSGDHARASWLDLSRPEAVRSMDGHRWIVLWVVVAANASFSAAFLGIPTTAVFMRAAYQLETFELGLALGLLGLGIAIGNLPWGLLADRWGDRLVLLSGLTATTAALILMALLASPTPSNIPTPALLAGGLFVVGLVGASVNGASGRSVMAWFMHGERGLAMSIRQTAMPAGGMVGALILPTAASRFGFTFVYLLLAAFCAATALCVWRWVTSPEEIRQAGDGELEARSSTFAAGDPFRDWLVWRVSIGIGVLCAPQIAILTFATVFLADVANASVATMSGAMAAVQVGGGVTRIWSGGWTDRHDNRRRYLRACSVLCALLFAAFAALVIAPGSAGLGDLAMPAIVAALVICGVCASAWNGVAFTELAVLAGAARAGTAVALGNTSVFVTFFLTPLAVPYLLAAWSWPGVWVAAGACALLAALVFPPSVRR